jgi:hypothetical protein
MRTSARISSAASVTMPEIGGYDLLLSLVHAVEHKVCCLCGSACISLPEIPVQLGTTQPRSHALGVHPHTQEQLVHMCSGMGHEGDELCAYEELGVRVAVRKLGLRWNFDGGDESTGIGTDRQQVVASDDRAWWSPRMWSSKAILDTSI